MTAPAPLKLLFIHPFGIGDVIFSLAAAEALTRRGHEVRYLCNERTEELLRLCPTVRGTHRFHRDALRTELRRSPIGALKRYDEIRRAIQGQAYDAALDFSMGREYAFLAWTAGIRRRIGWDYKGRGWWLTDRVPVTGFDERSPRDFALDLARLADPGLPTATSPLAAPHYPTLRLDRDAPTDVWLAGLTASTPWFVIAPGGGESWGRNAHYKQWPAEHWVRSAQLLKAQTRAAVLVIGSAAEGELVRSVARDCGGIPVCGEPLDRVLAALAGARAFIGSDGGLLHLANLARVPTVGIYGPVSETGYAPLFSAAPFRTLTADVPCRPCYRAFRFTGCAHQKRCLTGITPERVADEVRLLL